MDLDALAKHLSDTSRIGLTPVLAEKIGIQAEDATRGRLLAQLEGERGHLVVEFLSCYVVDDTDFFGKGEIYWWSIPVLVRKDGTVQKNPLHGLPNGMPPHKCGDQEWMTNITLDDAPIWAVIPPGDEYKGCVVRLGIYDDDRAPADMPGAMTEGMEALATASDKPLSGPDQLIHPVRDAITQHLRHEQDDILIDQDVNIRGGDVTGFGAGIIESVINSMARAYYFVRDTKNTQQFGPVTLHDGEAVQVRFDQPIKRGGRIALFARNASVRCPTFGELTVERPFINRVVDGHQEPQLSDGFEAVGDGAAAKFVAFYTPSYSD